jgi:predicted RNA binding protein YcfA (HicA-like mRNA interferase family)
MGKNKYKKKNLIKTTRGSELLQIALSFGWKIVRSEGSHFILKHDIIKNPPFLLIVITKTYSKSLMRSVMKEIRGEKYFN